MCLTALFQVLYLAAFATLHSVMASLPFKRLVWHVFGEDADRWYLKFFATFSAVAIAPLILMLLRHPGRKLYAVPSPWRWIMIGCQILATLATIKAFKDVPHRFTISQQLSSPARKNHAPLNPSGIYCWIRDPFMLYGIIQLWLTPFMTTRLLIINLLTTLYFYLGSLHWERRLGFQFGEEYENYRKKLPRFIPWGGSICRIDSLQ